MTKSPKRRGPAQWRAATKVYRLSFTRRYYRGVVVLGAEFDECPHKHRKQEVALRCSQARAEVLNRARQLKPIVEHNAKLVRAAVA